MWKENIKYGILILALLFVGCKESFLEIVPKGRLIAETTEDYSLLLTSRKLIVVNTNAQIPMGDEVVGVHRYFINADIRTQRLFRWDDIIYDDGIDAVEMQNTMPSIYLYNKVINETMDSKGGTELEKRNIIAQAKAARAWTYFMMINYYGKPYHEATAATDPGFPIMKEADVTQVKFERNSVKEVYDFIIQDLTEAIPDIMVEIPNRIRASKPFAEGMLGKVLLFMGRYQEALPYLTRAINGISNSAVPVGLYDYNVTFGPGGSMVGGGSWGPPYPLTPDVEESLFAKQAANDWMYSNFELVASDQTIDLYDEEDFRLNFYSNVTGGSEVFVYPNRLMRRMGPDPTQVGLLVSELYLLLAEGKARVNDLAGATADLTFFRTHRLPPGHETVPSDIASDRKALITYIFEERIREFALQGYRWFDMRRLSVDEEFKHTVGDTHLVIGDDGEVQATYKLKPERLVLRFTEKLMRQNTGMENNP